MIIDLEKRISKVGNIPALTDEERLLISRAAELSARCEHSAVASCFLSPRKQRILFEAGVTAGGFFFGGAMGTTRRKLVFLPSWMECEHSSCCDVFSQERENAFANVLTAYGSEDITGEFILPVRLISSGYEYLTHRDWLGGLLALGIKRETLGDICFFGGEVYVFAEPKTAAYIESELIRAGRDKVTAEICSLPKGFRIEHKFKNISATVASPRLDGVVRALCNVSREDAAELISGGMIKLNYFEETEVDRRVSDGDIISVRGYGKFIVDASGEITGKGRFRLSARKFV